MSPVWVPRQAGKITQGWRDKTCSPLPCNPFRGAEGSSPPAAEWEPSWPPEWAQLCRARASGSRFRVKVGALVGLEVVVSAADSQAAQCSGGKNFSCYTNVWFFFRTSCSHFMTPNHINVSDCSTGQQQQLLPPMQRTMNSALKTKQRFKNRNITTGLDSLLPNQPTDLFHSAETARVFTGPGNMQPEQVAASSTDSLTGYITNTVWVQYESQLLLNHAKYAAFLLITSELFLTFAASLKFKKLLNRFPLNFVPLQ